jgi:hypothetical protein
MSRCSVTLNEAVRAARALTEAERRHIELDRVERNALADTVMAYDYGDQLYISTLLTAHAAIVRVLDTPAPPAAAPSAAAPSPANGSDTVS